MCPEGLSIDWISSKIYWTDVRERAIGVMDLERNISKHSLINTGESFRPRGLALDPTVRYI